MSIGGPGDTKAGIDRAASTSFLILVRAAWSTVAPEEPPLELEEQLAIAGPRARVAAPPIASLPPLRISARRVSPGLSVKALLLPAASPRWLWSIATVLRSSRIVASVP